MDLLSFNIFVKILNASKINQNGYCNFKFLSSLLVEYKPVWCIIINFLGYLCYIFTSCIVNTVYIHLYVLEII